MNVKEITVPVPWGKIAVKLWGDPKNAAVLMCHGIEDNAASFDLLVPHLPTNYCYMCMDLPGHGQSDHFPQGLPIHTEDYVLAYKLVCDHFKRDHYIVFGHSYGGSIALLFALAHNRVVDKLILIDGLIRLNVKPENLPKWLEKAHDDFLKVHQNIVRNRHVTLTTEKAMEVMTTMRLYGNLSPTAAQVLFNRGVTFGADGKVKFRRDMRLRCALDTTMDCAYMVKVLESNLPTFKIMLLCTKEGDRSYDELIHFMRECLDARVVEVDGNHYVHLNEPKKVADVVNEFLLCNV